MHLKEAREKGKLAEFAKEHQPKHKRGNTKHFHAILKAMASKKTKPKKGTSPKGSGAS
jgi:hypothetical protein